MAAVEQTHPIGFIDWMAFGVPLALGLVTVVVTMVLIRFRPTGRFDATVQRTETLRPRARLLWAVLTLTITLWLTEQLHG